MTETELETSGLADDLGLGVVELVGFGVALGFGDEEIVTSGVGVAFASFVDLFGEAVVVGFGEDDDVGLGVEPRELKFPMFTTLLTDTPETVIEIVERPCIPSENK